MRTEPRPMNGGIMTLQRRNSEKYDSCAQYHFTVINKQRIDRGSHGM